MARGTKASDDTLVVNGLRDLLAEIDKTDRKTKKLMRDDLRQAAEPVRDYAATAFSRVSPHTARNYRITVRKTGVVGVEQRLRKTTGKRPDFGELQMRKALVPGLRLMQPKVIESLERSVERIASQLDKAGA